MFGRVVVPFDQFPAVYVRLGFGCPVEQGGEFKVLTCSGKWVS